MPESKQGRKEEAKQDAGQDLKKVFKTTIKAPVEAVWQEITRKDEVIPCFFNMRVNVDVLRPGAKMRMRTADGKYTPIIGDVLEFDPPRRFSHTFRFTQHDDPPCRVTYDLRPVPGGTEFMLTIDQLAPGTKTAKQMVQGTGLILSTLKATVERGRPKLAVRVMFSVFKLLQPLTPKKCLTENWP